MFRFWMLTPLLVTATAQAYNSNPFFSGDYAKVTIGTTGITMENDVCSRVVSLDLITTSLKIRGQEMIAQQNSEGTITLPSGTVDLVGSTIQDIQVEDEVEAKHVRVIAEKNGLNFVIHYRIFKGNRPWIAKWFEFLPKQRVESALVEKLTITSPVVNGSFGVWDDNGIAVAGQGYAIGLECNLPRPAGVCDRANNAITASMRVQQETDHTEQAVLCLAKGTKYTAAFGLQLFWGTYLAHASRMNRPVIYNTWYGYKTNVTEDDCARIAPTAKQLGADYFVVDDGWENLYGSWGLDIFGFPHGLGACSQNIRNNGMKFGFWIAPALTDPSAPNIDPSRLILNPGGAIWSPGMPAYCFATDWQQTITNKILSWVNETQADFLKLDFVVERDYCWAIDHPHAPGSALMGQLANWKLTCEQLRAARPEIVLDRGYSTTPTLGYNDMGWQTDWILAGLNDPRRQDPRWWYRSADSTRNGTGWTNALMPNWGRTGTTPAHLPGIETALDALEYSLASIVGSYCNLEFSGSLDGITASEMALCKKWVAWFRENQEYTAYTQIDDSTKRCYDPTNSSNFGSEWVDGMYHLRPKLNGKYGYLCFWNPSETAKTVTVNITPSDFFLPDDILKAAYKGLRGKWIKFNSGSTLKLTFTMPPLSWEFVEVFDPVVQSTKIMSVRGAVEFQGLSQHGARPSSVDMTVTPLGKSSHDYSVPLDNEGRFVLNLDVPVTRFTVSVKPSHWLRRTLEVDYQPDNNPGLNIVLSNGNAEVADNRVDVKDLNSVFSSFGTQDQNADLDGDGVVNLPDLNTVFSNFDLVGDD